MTQEKKTISQLLLLLISLIVIFIIGEYLSRFGIFGSEGNVLSKIYEIFKGLRPKLLIVRGIYVLLIAMLAILMSKPEIEEKEQSKVLPLLFAFFFSVLFIYGYNDYLYYNIIAYPLSFILSSLFVIKAAKRFVSFKDTENDPLSAINTGKENDKSLVFDTDKGKFLVPSPQKGIYIEGAAGSGKSVLIENMINQFILKGYAMFLYDYEGDPTEEDGAVLTRCVYASILNYQKKLKFYKFIKPFMKFVNNIFPKLFQSQLIKSDQPFIKFSFLNFTDLNKTVRINPISNKYMNSNLEILEISNIIMKNLERSWVEKTDFWAANAINYVQGCLLMLNKKYKQFLTVPHLISMVLSNYEAVLNFLSTDPDIERIMRPMITAHKEQAKSQTAGAVSSSQLPITKLYDPYIYWILSPGPEEEFSLDVSNKDNPVAFCVGNVPKLKEALGPVLALTMSICMNQMNQFGKRKSALIGDEIPTIFVPNIDNLPATARKKGVCTVLAAQTFKQLERDYGKINAEITRDNLSNQFIGKTNSPDTAERVSKLLGDYKKQEQSFTITDSGQSTTQSIKDTRIMKPEEISRQKTGHFCGIIADGDPSIFSAQFPFFKIKKRPIPEFSKVFNTGDEKLDKDLLERAVEDNFKKINQDIDTLLAPYIPVYDDTLE